MNELQAKLVALDLKKKEVEAFYEEMNSVLAELAKEQGLDSMFQAPDGTVYKIHKPTGTFVQYREVGYLRTKREGEDRGTLSVKEAESKGFKVK
jgi:Asp-tRNA(Asn)/Glu-tRNA(Gln) amidotransferase C subunit